jgi:ATP-dependent DNA helicase RecQ
MEGLDAAAADLLVHLKETRLALARAEGIAAFMVFPDRTLIEMARQKPRSADALRTLHGVGEAKLARYGEAFLAAIAASAAK